MNSSKIFLETVICLSILVAPPSMVAQFQKGDVELSLSGSLGKVSSSSSGFGSNSSSESFLLLSVSPGYYFGRGFSIEPEVGLLAVEDEEPGVSLIGNIAYTHRIPESDVALFLCVGYGVSNALSFPVPGGIPFRMSNEFDITVFNVGGGLKYVIKDAVALRLELNYRNHSWMQEYSYYGYSGPTSYTLERSYSHIGLLVGFSVLL